MRLLHTDAREQALSDRRPLRYIYVIHLSSVRAI